MKIHTVKEAMTIIENEAPKHAYASNNAQPKIANKCYDKIVAAMAYLKTNNSLKELKQLLKHKETSVVLWAATYLLKTDTNLAVDTLEEIKAMGIAHISMDAKYTLMEWHSGDLELYFKD